MTPVYYLINQEESRKKSTFKISIFYYCRCAKMDTVDLDQLLDDFEENENLLGMNFFL